MGERLPRLRCLDICLWGGVMRRKIHHLIIIAIMLLASTNAYAFKVVGYFTSWGTPGFEENLHYNYLTHVNYSFLLPTSSGGYTQTFSNTTQLDRLVQLAHNNNVKVLISVGGWNGGDDDAFSTIAASPSLRTTFINNLFGFVTAHNLDGVDIDWEFPDSTGSDNYTLLMAELSSRLKNSGKLLTAAVWGWNAEGVANSVYPYVDYLNLMAYDGGTPHSTYSMASSSLNFWKNTGLSQEKAILGIPFYGVNSSLDGRDYSALVAADGNAPYKDEGGSESVSGYYYNSIQTVKNKTMLAANEGGGVMIWALNSDTTNGTSLLTAIHEATPGGDLSLPLQVTTTTLPSGTVGTYYDSKTLVATGGSAPYSWSIVSGHLPTGLTLSSSAGVIGGVPTGSAGTSSFTIRCTDGQKNTSDKALSITIQQDQAKIPSYPKVLSIR